MRVTLPENVSYLAVTSLQNEGHRSGSHCMMPEDDVYEDSRAASIGSPLPGLVDDRASSRGSSGATLGFDHLARR